MYAIRSYYGKSTNRGTTWTPVFDDQPTGTFGVLALDLELDQAPLEAIHLLGLRVDFP